MNAQVVDKNLLLHLLTENKLTHCQIAKRVGCSPERVRQLEIKLLHRTGKQARLERRERELQVTFDKNKFVRAARKRGFEVKPLKRARGDWFKREFYVNGKLCSLRRAYKNVGDGDRYTRIRRPLQTAEVCVMEIGHGKFLIVPMKEMPSSSTMFSLHDADHYKRECHFQYFWRSYINNWAAFN
jgi:hypothetical protein